MTPVNHPYLLLDLLDVFLIHPSVHFPGCFYAPTVQPNAERTQRLFASLREELEKRGTKFATSGD